MKKHRRFRVTVAQATAGHAGVHWRRDIPCGCLPAAFKSSARISEVDPKNEILIVIAKTSAKDVYPTHMLGFLGDTNLDGY